MISAVFISDAFKSHTDCETPVSGRQGRGASFRDVAEDMKVGGYPLEEENGTLGVSISKKMWREWNERLRQGGRADRTAPSAMSFYGLQPTFPDF
jgi:hypothetical protein